jgi:hypothetical protein
MPSSSECVFDSPAVALLCQLEDAACAVGSELSATLLAGEKLRIAPAAILTAERTHAIQEYRGALRLLLFVNDPGVVVRRDAFAAYLASYRGSSIVPALRLTPSAAVVAGTCYSCAEPTTAAVWCPACQLAARLARGVALPTDWIPSLVPSIAMANSKVLHGL